MEIKRYNLALPKPMYDELKKIAEKECSTMLEVIKGFIKNGINQNSFQIASKLELKSGDVLVVKSKRKINELYVNTLKSDIKKYINCKDVKIMVVDPDVDFEVLRGKIK